MEQHRTPRPEQPGRAGNHSPALPWISVRGSGHWPTFGREDAFMLRSWGGRQRGVVPGIGILAVLALFSPRRCPDPLAVIGVPDSRRDCLGRMARTISAYR